MPDNPGVLTDPNSLERPVTEFIRTDFVAVRPTWTIAQCIASLRGSKEAGGIFYIYVTDDQNVLLGVIPIRQMLSRDPATQVNDIMIRELVSLPDSATINEAVDQFIEKKLLAFPVVDNGNHLLGLVDVNVFTDEMTGQSPSEQTDDVFQWIGGKMEVLRNASPLQAFRYRFPWLGATLASGITCAALAGAFEATLEQAVILAMFLTLALGLGESVSIQSMTLTIQALQGSTSLLEFIKTRLVREFQTAALLAIACGLIVGSISILWPGTLLMSASIGLSIATTIIIASLVGLAVPVILHKLNRDTRVAAGPITLALADIVTVILYLAGGSVALYLSN